MRRGDKYYLRIDAVLGLRQQVGGHKYGIGHLVGNDTHLRRPGGHVDGHVVQAYLLLGCHDILIAGAEDLVDLGYRLRAIGHGADSLYTANLENLADTSYASSHQDSRIDMSFAVGWGAEHYLAAAGNLCRSGQHQYRRKQRCCAAGNVKPHLLDGYALLPADDTGLRLYLFRAETLCLVKFINVFMSQFYGMTKVGCHHRLGLGHLLLADGQRLQVYVVELQFIALHGLVATLADIGQHGSHGCV